MITVIFYLFQDQGFFQQFLARIYEGGPFPMTLILLLFFLMIFFIIRSALKLRALPQSFRKSVSLVNQVALLAVIIGLFFQLIGLIQVFDAFESLGNLQPALLAGGLKVTLLPPIFGGLTFIIGRMATFILNWLRKEDPVTAA
ncbi:MAG: MotA/TolQ/ExbB proton channel family protein [Bacteroidota bacterium]|nr:MotA/TolQ/ExbB proton channel family protein [Bacteroidota bacterium]